MTVNNGVNPILHVEPLFNNHSVRKVAMRNKCEANTWSKVVTLGRWTVPGTLRSPP